MSPSANEHYIADRMDRDGEGHDVAGEGGSKAAAAAAADRKKAPPSLLLPSVAAALQEAMQTNTRQCRSQRHLEIIRGAGTDTLKAQKPALRDAGEIEEANTHLQPSSLHEKLPFTHEVVTEEESSSTDPEVLEQQIGSSGSEMSRNQKEKESEGIVKLKEGIEELERELACFERQDSTRSFAEETERIEDELLNASTLSFAIPEESEQLLDASTTQEPRARDAENSIEREITCSHLLSLYKEAELTEVQNSSADSEELEQLEDAHSAQEPPLKDPETNLKEDSTYQKPPFQKGKIPTESRGKRLCDLDSSVHGIGKNAYAKEAHRLLLEDVLHVRKTQELSPPPETIAEKREEEKEEETWEESSPLQVRRSQLSKRKANNNFNSTTSRRGFPVRPMEDSSHHEHDGFLMEVVHQRILNAASGHGGMSSREALEAMKCNSKRAFAVGIQVEQDDMAGEVISREAKQPGSTIGVARKRRAKARSLAHTKNVSNFSNSDKSLTARSGHTKTPMQTGTSALPQHAKLSSCQQQQQHRPEQLECISQLQALDTFELRRRQQYLQRQQDVTHTLLLAVDEAIGIREQRNGGASVRRGSIVGAVAVNGPNATDDETVDGSVSTSGHYTTADSITFRQSNHGGHSSSFRLSSHGAHSSSFRQSNHGAYSSSFRQSNRALDDSCTIDDRHLPFPLTEQPPDMEKDESMIEAMLVEEGGAQFANSNALYAHAHPLKKRTPVRLLLFAGGILILVVVAIIAITLELSNNSTSSKKKSTLVPFSVDLLPNSTQFAVKNPESSQSKALQWVFDDPNFKTYNASRAIQRFALATLYYSTNGGFWTEDTNWLSHEVHECRWFTSFPYDICGEGVGNDNMVDDDYRNEDDFHFISLGLLENNITGSLPPEVGLLSDLLYFDIAANPLLRGTLPTEIGLWTDMTYFSARKTQLTGTIPTEVGMMRKVVEFQVSASEITGTLPTELGLLRDTQYLYLQKNPLNTGPIPSELGQLAGLLELDLGSLSLTGAMPVEFGNFYRLSSLRLGNNVLSRILPDSYAGNLSSGPLEILHLQNNQIRWEDGKGNSLIPSWVSSVEEHFL